MVHYKLTDFDSLGYGETIRYILSYGGQEFEDERIKMDQWKQDPSLKAKTPMGQLPVLEIDGKQMLCQSSAICRFLAKEFGIAGSNNLEQAQVDMYVDGFKDLFPKAMPWFMEYGKKKFEGAQNDDKIKETYNNFKTEALVPFMDICEKVLNSNGGGYLVGSKVSWADLTVAEFLYKISLSVDPQVTANHCKLAAMVKKVHELPGIREYLVKHPPQELL